MRQVFASCLLKVRAATSTSLTFVRNAKAISKKLLPEKEDESFVEENAEMLCKNVCINYYLSVEGAGPEILPDCEYPKWLLELDLKPKPVLEDLDPNRNGWTYWQAYKERRDQQIERYNEIKHKFISLQRSPTTKKYTVYSKHKHR